MINWTIFQSMFWVFKIISFTEVFSFSSFFFALQQNWKKNPDSITSDDAMIDRFRKEGEETKIQKPFADILEAVIGSILTDQGFEAASKFITHWILEKNTRSNIGLSSFFCFQLKIKT